MSQLAFTRCFYIFFVKFIVGGCFSQVFNQTLSLTLLMAMNQDYRQPLIKRYQFYFCENTVTFWLLTQPNSLVHTKVVCGRLFTHSEIFIVVAAHRNGTQSYYILLGTSQYVVPWQGKSKDDMGTERVADRQSEEGFRGEQITLYEYFDPSVAMINMGRREKSSTAINRTCGKVMCKIAFTYKLYIEYS